MKGYKILDNGAAESELCSFEELISLAHDLEVDEVVIPDVLGDHNRTVELLHDFKPYAKANSKFKYMGVVQGRSHGEVAQCIMQYAHNDFVSVVALPRVLCRMPDFTKFVRFTLTEFIQDLPECDRLELHILGSSMWTKEVLLLADKDRIRSMDTCMPIVLGAQGAHLEKNPMYTGRYAHYFDLGLDNKQLELANANCNVFLTWAGAPTPTRKV